MKEKDIVDFTKFEVNEDGELVDDKGVEIGCKICYTHDKARQVLLEKMQLPNGKLVPLCPKCGNQLRHLASCGYEAGVVSEVNYSNPEGEINLYEFWHCSSNDCDANNFALVPIPVMWNANHDIFYTGGRDYAEDADVKKLVESIFEKIKPSIIQYVNRKLNPKNVIDEMLDERNVLLWAERDVEHAVCDWLYDHGLKK